MAERIGQYLNRTFRQGASDFGDEATLQADTIRRSAGDIAGQFTGAQQGFTQFLGDLSGATPYVPDVQRRIDRANMDAAQRGVGGPVEQPIGVPSPATPTQSYPAGYGDGSLMRTPPPAPTRMSVYDTPDNPGSLSYTDHGTDTDRGATLAGLRQRAMSTGAMNYPNLQEYNHSSTPSAPNSYDRPMGGAASPIVMNPLLSLSASQIAQDEGARTEREARFGGERQDRLTQQAQELQGEQLRYQMEDPTGIEMKRKLMHLAVDQQFGVNRDKAGIEATGREAVRRDFAAQFDRIERSAAAALARIEAMPASPEKEAERVRLEAAKQAETDKLKASFGISEHVNSPGLLGTGRD